MNRLIAVLGVLFLAVAVVLYWPFALLIVGTGLLLLSAVRIENQRRVVRRQ